MLAKIKLLEIDFTTFIASCPYFFVHCKYFTTSQHILYLVSKFYIGTTLRNFTYCSIYHVYMYNNCHSTFVQIFITTVSKIQKRFCLFWWYHILSYDSNYKYVCSAINMQCSHMLKRRKRNTFWLSAFFKLSH